MSREENNSPVGESVESLKSKLYSRAARGLGGDVRTPLPQSSAHTPVGWEGAPPAAAEEKKLPPLAQFEPKRRMSLATKFFIAALAFFLVAAGAAAYIFFGGANIISAQNIDMQIIAPSLVDGGKEATLQIIITNRNQAALNLVDMAVDYPAGTRDPKDQNALLQHERQSVGTIAAGESVTRTASAIFYGQEGIQQTVTVTLQYSVPGSNAVFQKQTQATITIGSSPVSLSAGAPSEAISGQPFSIDITLQSNATTPLQRVVVGAQYPFGFTLQNSSPQATAGGTFWALGALSPGQSKVIHLTGSIDGQDGDSRVFRFLVGSNTDQTDTVVRVPFITVPQTITVQKPFITGTIAVDGQSGKTISVAGGKTVQGTITWLNNLPDAVNNVELTLALSGPALDPGSIGAAQGFYQSANSTIVWNASQDPSLAKVAPGGTGNYQFSFATLAPGSGGSLITNPSVTLNLMVKGTRQGQSGVPESVSSAASTQVQLASALSLDATTLYASGPFTNTGPTPPVVGQDTSYTIQWTVKNSSNTVGGATVSAVLPTYVRFVKGGTSDISYDAASRTVVWSLGDLKAGVGYTSASQTAAFQIVLTPSVSQINTLPQLTGNALCTGQDRFAQVKVSASAQAPTTNLSDSFNSSTGLVQSK